MSLKRKFEEYHDPDYPQPQATTTKQSKPNVTTTEERCEKIRSIVHREFEKELQHKEDELQQIDHKLQESKRLLQRVRYAIVANFYRKQNLEYTERELQHQFKSRHSSTDTQSSTIHQAADSDGNKLTTQTTVHPSLKKLLGKHPIDYNEILKIRPARQAAKTAKTTISEKLRSKRDERRLRPPEAVTIREDVEPKVPRYVSPIKTKQHFEKLTSARGRNNFRHLLAVGNTSKYIGDEKSLDGVTHKWLVYVKTKLSNVDIADIVSEVRFFLHPSYQPNDVVKVDCPPFQLSRRGWGEFPIRLQLYFYPHIQQKPLQIIHNLVLDKRLTGLQTMGAETIVELYLNIPNANSQELFNNEEIMKETETNSQTMKVVFKHEPPIDLPATILQEHEHFNSSSPSTTMDNHHVTTITEQTQPQIDLPAIIMQGHESSSLLMDKQQNQSPIDLPSIVMQEHEYYNSSSSSLSGSHHVRMPDHNNIETIAKTIKQEKDYVQPVPNNVVQPIVTNVTTQPILNNIPTINQKPNFVKCLDSNGKVIIVQLVTDPNNPKNIKIIRNPKLNLQANNLNSSTNSSPMVSIPTIPKTIQIASSLNNQLVKPYISTKNLLNVPQIQKINHATLSKTNEQQKLLQNSAATTTKNKTIIVKNGQIFVIQNTDGSVKNLNRPIVIQKPKPKQESLLKPQISLLKTNFNKQSVNIGTSMPVYQNQPSIKNVIKYKSKPLPPITYQKRLETLFFENNQLNTMKQAVTMLLKHVPLFSNKLPTNDINFRAEFPFICNSETSFMALSSEQKKCFEWYRAKYIQKICKKHKKFENFTNEMWWSTKEILLYARRIGYTPTILMDNLQTNKIELKKIIQREIKQEQLNNVDTLTLHTMVNNWISKRENEKLNQNDVDDNDDNLVINIDECDNNKTRKDVRNISFNYQQMQQKNTDWLPLDNNILKESAWVTDLCRDIQITLLPEEICQGVMHLSAQRTLIQALHSFVEDLLRQSLYNKNINTERIDINVGSDDIRKVISKINRFDFCTNKYLGIKSINQ